MRAKSEITVIQVIPKRSGGGAEVLVKELHRRLTYFNIVSHAIYFSDKTGLELDENEHALGHASFRSPLLILKLRRQMKKIFRDRSDKSIVIHCHLTWALYYVPLALIGLRARLLYTEHSTNNRRRAVPFLSWIERYWYRRYVVIICISEGVRAKLKVWLGLLSSSDNGRLVVVPNGARLFAPRPDRRYKHVKEEINVVAAGFLDYRKGFDIALSAIALCRDDVAHLTLVGDGPMRRELENQARDLGISDIVSFAGWVEDIESYYRQADVALISSRWEGFGLVAVESLSAGLPLVCPDLPGLGEVVCDCNSVFLCTSESPKSMASAIKRVAREIRLGRNFEDTSTKRASRFDISNMVSNYADIYKSVGRSR